MIKSLSTLILLFFIFSCSNVREKDNFDFSESKKKLIPLYQLMGEPKNGDWLESHKEENISFEKYKALKPVRVDSIRNKIYIQPIGKFSNKEEILISKTAEYLKAFYGLKIEILKTISDSIIPAKNRRMVIQPIFVTRKEGNNTRQFWVDSLVEQLQTKYILKEILKPKLPKDAVTFIAFCNKDLYPDENYNFVFGYASLKDRVGVWSFNRFGSIEKEYEQVLMRTLKTASHETGHMFSIKHCSNYYCIMNGSNSLEEADKKPTLFCPDCLEKFCWNFKIEPKVYFERVKLFWKENDFNKEVKNYDRFIEVLKKN